MADERKTWEQQAGEPSEAYARFLIYRNLGPARSLDAAYKSTLTVTKGNKKQRAPGQWTADSTRYKWVERSTAWDIEMMSTLGIQTVVRFIASLDAISQKALTKLLDDKTKPKDWNAAVDAISKLGNFIPADTVRAIQDNASSGEMSAIGTSGGNTST